jgi:phytoene synthase
MKSAAEIFQKNAKTFSFAGRFFDNKTRSQIELMYSFFRWVDDLAERTDQKSHLTLQSLTTKENDEVNAEWNAVRGLFCELDVETPVLEEFLICMKSDQKGIRITCERDLIRYCYGAASTVGLCLIKAFKVTDTRAWAFAIDLGIAMQLTNIIRDIDEDYRNDKIYLPDLCYKRLEDLSDEELTLLKIRYVRLADQYYASARRGFVFLNPRVRFCVGLAATLYRKIGILALKPKFLRDRAHTHGLHKATALATHSLHFLSSLVIRPKIPVHNTDLHQDLQGLPYVRQSL